MVRVYQFAQFGSKGRVWKPNLNGSSVVDSLTLASLRVWAPSSSRQLPSLPWPKRDGSLRCPGQGRRVQDLRAHPRARDPSDEHVFASTKQSRTKTKSTQEAQASRQYWEVCSANRMDGLDTRLGGFLTPRRKWDGLPAWSKRRSRPDGGWNLRSRSELRAGGRG